MALDESLDPRERQTIRAGDTDGVRVSYAEYLRAGETVSSVSAIEITGTSTNISVSSAAPSTAILKILGLSVAVAEAVTFTVAATTSATAGLYEVALTTASSASRTAIRRVGINVVL